MSSFVLVHGAWSDASAWDAVADLLRDGGHTVVAPGLPGHGSDPADPADVMLDTYADVVVAAAESLGGDVVLVGHSMAGTVISTVAERHPQLAAQLVYVAAFLLTSGESLYGFTQTSPGMADSLLGPALRPGDGVLAVDPDRFVAAFCAQADGALAAAALTSLRPEPLAPLGTPITVSDGRWGAVPRAYVHTTADACVSPASQREMVTAIPTPTWSLDSDHLVMLSHPVALATLLADIAAGAA